MQTAAVTLQMALRRHPSRSGIDRAYAAKPSGVSRPIDFAVSLDPAVQTSLVTKDGQLHLVVANRYQATVPAGDVAIFAWPAATREALSNSILP